MTRSSPPRAITYVDALNLYGSALRGSANKWLDIHALAATLTPATHTLAGAKYFTADLLPDTSEDPAAPKRQRNYVKALVATGVDVRRGVFIVNKEWRTVATHDPWPDRLRPAPSPNLANDLSKLEDTSARPMKAKVLLPIEKFTDVALGVEIVDDFHTNRCEMAIVITNDSDLHPAISKATEQGHTVNVFTPGDPNRYLREAASDCKPLRPNLFATHQLRDPVVSGTTQYHKPNAWKEK